MSREGILSRARAQARFVDEAIAQGAGFYLLGCPIVVLYNEPVQPAASWPSAQLGEPKRNAANDAAPP